MYVRYEGHFGCDCTYSLSLKNEAEKYLGAFKDRMSIVLSLYILCCNKRYEYLLLELVFVVHFQVRNCHKVS
jgi:hypothetical protein